jgi:hypothetical protein
MRVRHSWAQKAISSLVAAMVISCVWYVWHNRPKLALATPASYAQAADLSAVHASAELLEPISPTVQKQGSTLRFSVATTAYANVQKVEFYVENQFVGAAYSPPYSVAVSETSLATGTHQLTAKIFTPTTTAQSQPAAFTAQSDIPATTTISSHTPPPTAQTGTPPPTPALPAPANMTASAADDGTSVTLNWDTAAGASHYQVWRDNTQIATVAGTGYSDTGLKPGQTYDYYVVATNNTGDTSASSQILAITTPTPQDTSPVNTNGTSTPNSTASTTDAAS